MSDTQSEQPSTSLQDIEEIKRQLEVERVGRQETERQLKAERAGRQETNQRLQSETAARFSAQEESIASTLTTLDTQAKSLKEQYKAALDAGDTVKAADINELLVEVKVQQTQAKQAKAQIEAVKAQPRQPAQQPTQQRSPKAQAWIDAHPEFNTDQRFQHRVVAAHNEALAEVIRVNADEYFDFVNGKMGFKPAAATQVEPEEGAENEDILIEPTPAPVPQRKAQIVTAAPVSRSAAGST